MALHRLERMMSESQVVTESQGAIRILRLNRADKKNAMTGDMYRAAAAAVNAASDDPSVRVLVITGSGEAFCAGNDMVDFLKNTPSGVDDAPVIPFMRNLAACPKPVLAAVNGIAIGIGVTLLLHCDLVYASAQARFQFPFTNIGIVPEFASTLMLPSMMGHQRAAELTLFGEFFGADQAREVGLINNILPAADLFAHTMERAGKLALQPPNALRTTKALLKRWPQAQVDEAIRVEAEHFLPMLKMPEAHEAIGAFLEKRKPDFSRFE